MNRYLVPGRCPDCGAPIGSRDRCGSCGLLLVGPVADDLRAGLAYADRVLDVLRHVSAAPPAPAPGSPPVHVGSAAGPSGPAAGPSGPAAGQSGPAAAPVGSAAPSAGLAPAARRRGLPAMSVPLVLLGLGTVCVLVAAVVFVAVTWTDLSLAWRTTILLAVTALATGAAVWSVRRRLRAAAEALTLVSSGLLLIDLLAGNDAGLPVLSAVQGRPFDWAVALTMLTTGLAWPLWAHRHSDRSLLGQQVVVMLAAAEAVRLAALDWRYDQAWLAALVTVACALLAVALRRVRLLVAASALGTLAVLAWLFLTAAGLVRAVLADGPHDLFAGLDGGPLLVSGALAGVVTVLPRLPAAARVVAAVFAFAGPVVVVLLPARELGDTAGLLVVAGAALALAAGGLVAPAPWRYGLRAVAAAAAVLPGFVLVVGAEIALSRLSAALEVAWTRSLGATLPAADVTPPLQVWAFLPVGFLAAAALSAALLGRDRPRRLLVGTGAGAGIGALTAVLSAAWPLAAVGAVLAAAAAAGVALLARTRSRVVAGMAGVPAVLGVGAGLPSAGASALFLAVYAVLLAVTAGLLRARTRSVLVALAVVSAAVSLEALAHLRDVSLPAAGLVLLAAAAVVLAAAQVLARRPDGASWRRGLEAVVLPVTIVALAQTLDDQVLRTVAAGAAAAATGALAALVRDRRWVACVSAAFLAATAHQVVLLAGAAPPWRAVAVAGVAGVAVLVAQGLPRLAGPPADEDRPARTDPRLALELTSLLLGVLSVDTAVPASLALTVALTWLGVAAVAVSLLAADRRRVAWLGSLLLLAASWVRLSALDVDVIEAYTLPGSVALLVAGLVWMRRTPTATSWQGLATPLALGVGPSLAVALQEPTTVRALLLGLAGLGLVAAGARLGWGAPLLVGGVGVALLAVANIAPYAAAVPRWVLFGTAGVALLVLGVTWERRRQDLRTMHRYAARLR